MLLVFGLFAMTAGVVFAQRGGYAGGAARAPLPSSTAIGAGALTHGPSSTAASSSAAFAFTRPYGGNRGGGTYGGRGYNSYNRGYNNYRTLPRNYVIAPFYYPSFDWSGGTDTSAAPNDGDPGYGYGPDPATDAMMQNQAALGQQVQRLTAEVNSMKYGQPGPYDVTPTQQQATPPAPPITLVLHSGEHVQLQNYAVASNMFWDFTQHGTRKFPLSSIDLAASEKATEAAGGEFPMVSGATH
jgi:hypothetical protein